MKATKEQEFTDIERKNNNKKKKTRFKETDEKCI